MESSILIRLGGLAAMVGGLLWVVKGGDILLTGQQPPLVFEAALPLFAVGLLGLYARLGGRTGQGLYDHELADFLLELRDETSTRAERAENLLAQRLADGGVQ